ncbi:AAA family ATPase [Rhodococcus hoagii]|nr:AAA family ATPase [Prescottella equi]NKZ87193.1 AAA family ATPase [Prescottella equi]
MRAVAAAAQGRTFVLEGPPGTGKSQTITNLIAHALDIGKTVLFVAEKQAALDVVKKRLGRVGLSEFTLDLHGKSQSPNAIREQLRTAIDHTTRYNEHGWTAKLADFRTRTHRSRTIPRRSTTATASTSRCGCRTRTFSTPVTACTHPSRQRSSRRPRSPARFWRTRSNSFHGWLGRRRSRRAARGRSSVTWPPLRTKPSSPRRRPAWPPHWRPCAPTRGYGPCSSISTIPAVSKHSVDQRHDNSVARSPTPAYSRGCAGNSSRRNARRCMRRFDACTSTAPRCWRRSVRCSSRRETPRAS